MSAGAGRLSFHDPDGSVYLAKDAVWRALRPAAADRIDAFLTSEPAAALTRSGNLPATIKATPPDPSWTESAGADARWYRHERLSFVNYPHEWIPEQLAEACVFTLGLADELRKSGWDLKDGNARNVLFDGLRPVFVDFGSFQERDDSEPVWRPAGPVQRHFLLPLLVHRHLGLAPSSVLLGRPDGISHAEAFGCLRRWRWTDRHVFWLCTLPTLLSRRRDAATRPVRPAMDPQLCRVAVDRTIRGLHARSVAMLRGMADPNSEWAAYETSRAHYAETQLQRKRDAVTRMLDRIRPAHVLDVGTNGGEFANLAARGGSRVVSIDMDLDALRAARSAAVKQELQVLHLHVDFTAPTPALGWNGAECLSFDQRARGAFDLVLALAVLHHVLVSGRIPLDEALSKLASYTRSHLIIEYVDPTDVMFGALARERRSDFSSLDRESFERAISRHFRIDEQVEIIPGRRTLYLCSRSSV